MSNRPTVGSSDVGAILGLSPWAGPWDVWARLTGLVPRYSGASGATLRGQILEPAIRDWHAADLGVTVAPGPLLTDPGLPITDWAHARPDGSYRIGGTIRGVEVKTTRDFYGWGDDGTGDVPAYYAAQVAWQRMALERLHGAPVAGTDLVAFCPMEEAIRRYDVPANPEVEARLLARVGAWYERHIVGGEMPDMDASQGCVAAMRALYCRPSREWLEPTEEDERAAAEMMALKSEIDARQARFDTLKNTLCNRIGNAYGITGVARWAPSGKTRRFTLEFGE